MTNRPSGADAAGNLTCPSCSRPRDAGKYLCLACWSALPVRAQASLKRRDRLAVHRLRELLDQIHERHTPRPDRGNPVTTADHFDRDPDALAWARAKIQESITRAEECAANKTLPTELRERWRHTAGYMRRDLLDRDGVVHAAFDTRWPATLTAIDPLFTCPRCTRTSHHPADKRCGHCHDYTGART